MSAASGRSGKALVMNRKWKTVVGDESWAGRQGGAGGEPSHVYFPTTALGPMWGVALPNPKLANGMDAVRDPFEDSAQENTETSANIQFGISPSGALGFSLLPHSSVPDTLHLHSASRRSDGPPRDSPGAFRRPSGQQLPDPVGRRWFLRSHLAGGCRQCAAAAVVQEPQPAPSCVPLVPADWQHHRVWHGSDCLLQGMPGQGVLHARLTCVSNCS
jgi:hypothetical protein